MIYNEKDFYKKSKELHDAVVNELYMNLCNSNNQVKSKRIKAFINKRKIITTQGISLPRETPF